MGGEGEGRGCIYFIVVYLYILKSAGAMTVCFYCIFN